MLFSHSSDNSMLLVAGFYSLHVCSSEASRNKSIAEKMFIQMNVVQKGAKGIHSVCLTADGWPAGCSIFLQNDILNVARMT